MGRSPAGWATWVEEQKRRGVSQRAFCVERGIAYSTLQKPRRFPLQRSVVTSESSVTIRRGLLMRIADCVSMGPYR